MKNRRRIKKRGTRRRARAVFFPILILVTVGIVVFVSLVDRRLLPAVIQIEEYRINARINEAINQSLVELTDTLALTASDFYTATRADDGRITSLSADTMLINDVALRLSQSLIHSLSNPIHEHISVPVGALLGFNWLANIGPSYRIRIMSVGMADIEHRSAFASGGINQINFQVWFTIHATMQIVNPLQDSREVEVTRDILLVNTVITGEIPDAMLWPAGR